MSSDVRAQIARALAGVRLALRGRLLRLSGARVMQAQAGGLAGETFQGAEFFQQAGFRSRPLAGAEVVIVPLHGSSAHGVVIACANGKLFVSQMQDGETAIFNETDGHFVHLKNGKIIEMQCDTLNITAAQAVNISTAQFSVTASAGARFATPELSASANIKAAGEVFDHNTKSMSAMRVTYGGHTHSDPQGGSVGGPNAQM